MGVAEGVLRAPLQLAPPAPQKLGGTKIEKYTGWNEVLLDREKHIVERLNFNTLLDCCSCSKSHSISYACTM